MSKLILKSLLLTLFFLLPQAAEALQHRKVLVTGCGRSGTGYMCKFFKLSGLRVHHEYMGEDGSVSWLLGVNAPWAPWGPLQKDFQFDHIFHQVRHPVKVIQSFYNFPPLATWEWISTCIPEILMSDSDLTKCAKYWVYWNQRIANIAEWTYRIEDFDKCYVEMGRRLGFVFNKEILSKVGKKTNTKGLPTRIITWEILQAELDQETFDALCAAALHYGYTPFK